jgi:hypothetical protein
VGRTLRPTLTHVGPIESGSREALVCRHGWEQPPTARPDPGPGNEAPRRAVCRLYTRVDWHLNLLEHSVETVEEMIEQQFEELATVAKRQGAKNLPIHSRLRGESRPQPERVR